MSPRQPTSPNPAPTPPAGSPAIANPRLWSQRNMALLYDLVVTRGTYWALWGCPWPRVAPLYTNLGPTHLEIGPGSGFFLNRATFPTAHTELHLLDLHEGPLRASAARLSPSQPVVHQHDAMEPFPLEDNSIDTLAMGMVLHCLPGANIRAKAAVFDHIAAVLRPGGRFFGATVLAHGVAHSALGRAGLGYLNTKGVFHNHGDSLTDLVQELATRFEEVRIAVYGAVALWQGTAR